MKLKVDILEHVNGKRAYGFEYNGVYWLAGDFNKDNKSLPSQIKYAIISKFGRSLNFQKKASNNWELLDEYAYDVEILSITSTYDVEDETSRYDTKQNLSNNTNNKMSKIEEYKVKTFFTDDKISEIASAVEVISENKSYLLEVVTKIEKIVNTINNHVERLSNATDDGDYTVANKELGYVKALNNFIKSADKIEDLIKVGKELSAKEEDNIVEQLKEELGL